MNLKFLKKMENLLFGYQKLRTPNLANIEKPDDSTEVLIFKQAIALGWDCPRASILVLFRDWKSFKFSYKH